jgi:hypothetical protein
MSVHSYSSSSSNRSTTSSARHRQATLATDEDAHHAELVAVERCEWEAAERAAAAAELIAARATEEAAVAAATLREWRRVGGHADIERRDANASAGRVGSTDVARARHVADG